MADGANQQPQTALVHFRDAQRLTGTRDKLHGLAAYDTAVALYYLGAYRESADAFHALLIDKQHLCGYDFLNCTLFYRHVFACANYHSERAAKGIPEPPRLDPLCGVAALATCLRSLGKPYDKATLLAHCRVNGRGSNLQDILNAAPGLGVTARAITADDHALRILPKPLVAFIERDHFVAVTAANDSGVSYLCSDCGSWPGGAVHLTWAQWHLLNPGIYGVVTVPGSDWDKALELKLAGKKIPSPSVASNGSMANMLPIWTLLASATISQFVAPTYISCGYSGWSSLHCTDPVCCPMAGPGGGGPGGPGGPNHTSPTNQPTGTGSGGGGTGAVPLASSGVSAYGSSAGDPVNLATGEEEYKPGADITVYNPHGPNVEWRRIYNSLRGNYEQQSYNSFQYSYSYNQQDYGSGWSNPYNVFVLVLSYTPGYSEYLTLANGSRVSFTLGASTPTTTSPTACIVQPGMPYQITWNNGASGYYFTVTFPDRSQWVTRAAVSGHGNFSYCYLDRIVDRNGHSIHFHYVQDTAPNGSEYQLSSIANDDGTALLTINRAAFTDPEGNNWPANSYITSITDCYSRSVFYLEERPTYLPRGPVLTHVSQIVASTNTSGPDRYAYIFYGYSSPEQNDLVYPFLSWIIVPAANGPTPATQQLTQGEAGTVETEINYATTGPTYVTSIVDGNSNVTQYTQGTGNTTTVAVGYLTGSTFNAKYTFTAGFDSNMSQTYRTDGNGTTLATATYSDPYDPLRPSSVTDANSHTTGYKWDSFGNLHEMTSPRGTVTDYTWAFPGSVSSGYPVNSITQTNAPVLGELTKVQETAGTGGGVTQKAATTYAYFDSANNGASQDWTNSGLISTITKPTPGTSAGTTTVSYTFQYDHYGNMTQMVTPGNGAASSITTTLAYATGTSVAIGQPLTITDNLGHATHFTYDSQGNRTSMTDAIGNATYFGHTDGTAGYNIANQPVLVTYPATGQTGSGAAAMTMRYRYPDGPQTATVNFDEGGTQVREVDTGYGPEGETLSVTGSTEPVYYTYDRLYRLATLTDGSGHAASPTRSTAYFYNAQGYLAQVVYPGAAGTSSTPTAPLTAGTADTVTFSTYDPVGNLTKRVDGRNIETDYAYAADNKLTDVTYPASTANNVHYDYDGYGRKTGMADAVSGDTTTTPITDGVAYSYDDNDALTSVATTYNVSAAPPYTVLPTWTTSYTYNANASRAGMVLAGTVTKTSSYTYDGAGRLTGLTNPNSEASSWTYGNNNWLATQTLGNGVTTTNTYDHRGNIAELAERQTSSPTSALVADFGGTSGTVPGMSYDAVGNRTGYTASGFPTGAGTLNGTTTYSYDGRNELTGETTSRYYGTNTSNTYQYDGVATGTTTGAGNGTSVKGTGFGYNAAGHVGDNQMASDTQSHSYAFDGNGNPTTWKSAALTFDVENRMTAYGTSLTAGYNGDGLRAWKQDSLGNRTYFVYDGTNVIGELNATGNLGVVYTWGANGLLSRKAGSGGTQFFTYDPTGSVATVTNSAASVQGDELFDATGKRLNSYSSRPVDFCGQWGYYDDAETGLILCGHRYYDSFAARFLNRDPIWFDGGVNLYGYRQNNSVYGIDPEGLVARTSPLGGPQSYQECTELAQARYDRAAADNRRYLPDPKKYREKMAEAFEQLAADNAECLALEAESLAYSICHPKPINWPSMPQPTLPPGFYPYGFPGSIPVWQ